jgi:hypothetical protein
MYMASKKTNQCSKCKGEVEQVSKRDPDKLLKASIDTPPLTLKELKAKLKKERDGKGSK